MARKSKTISTSITSREDLERRVGEYAESTAKIAEIEAQMNLEIAKVREKFEGKISDIKASADTIFDDLNAYASLHPETFPAGRKSVDLIHGTLGFRTGQPSLSIPRGKTAEDLCNAMLALPAVACFVRRTNVVDKSAVIGALTSDKPSDSKAVLSSIGFRVTQAERFYVDPKYEEVEK